jgi:hypothetical protein
MITESRIFNINSQSGTKNNGSKNTNIDYFLPNFVNNQNDDEILCAYLSIKNAEIPVSFYLINEYNNALSINNISYTLTKGNYNINNFITSLTALLGISYSITYNKITLKITISSSTSFTINYSKTTMSKFLGISSTSDTISVLNNSLYTITSPYVVNFLPIQKIHLRTNVAFDNFNNYDKSNDILLSIQNNANILGGVILYNNDTNLKYLVNEKDVSTFTLRITDDFNREIDLNNCDFFITFQIDYIYRTIPVKNNLGRFIKNNNLNFIKEYILSLEQEEE